MKLLLIAGVPGTGKTTIGDYLRDNHQLLHLNVELLDSWSENIKSLFLSNNWIGLYKFLQASNKDVVMTWGFMPGVHDPAVKQLQQIGFKLIWFDGNREAARNAFNKRATVAEYYLDIQMKRIENMNLGSFNPVVINTFDENGDFLSKEEIVRRLLEV